MLCVQFCPLNKDTVALEKVGEDNKGLCVLSKRGHGKYAILILSQNVPDGKLLIR